MENKNKRKSQIPFAILLCILIGLFMIYIDDIKLSLYLLFGIGFGFIIQRSRFCFTAVFRDPVLTKTTTMTNALLLALGVGNVGVFGLNIYYSNIGKKLVGLDAVYPLSILTIVGGILFGIGMVIVSGCASGILVRMGEGFKLQWIGFLFFLIGAMIGSFFMGYLYDTPITKGISVFIPDYIGWYGAVILQLILLFISYKVFEKIKKRKTS